MANQQATDYSHNQVAVGAVETAILSLNSKRIRVHLHNTHATNTAFVGKTGVTIANGFPILAGQSHTFETRAEIKAIAAAASSLAYVEETS